MISRELSRNVGFRGYRYKQAQTKAVRRNKDKPKAIKLTTEVSTKIDFYLKKDWSPEQISGRMKKQKSYFVSHQAIYDYIKRDRNTGGCLYRYLRCQKTYRKRYGSKNNKTGIPNRVDIDKRPQAANDRKRIGDFEADTIIGKNQKGAILTLDDRKCAAGIQVSRIRIND